MFWVLGANLREPVKEEWLGQSIVEAKEDLQVGMWQAWLFEEKSFDDSLNRVRETIDECTHEDVGLITRHNGGWVFPNLKLTVRGKEMYSVTYLISRFLGNAYVKTAIIGFVGYLFTTWASGVFKESLPTNNERYGQGYNLQVEEFRRWTK